MFRNFFYCVEFSFRSCSIIRTEGFDFSDFSTSSVPLLSSVVSETGKLKDWKPNQGILGFCAREIVGELLTVNYFLAFLFLAT